MTRYMTPTDAAAIALFSRGITGPVVMLNLMRFRKLADYSATPDLAPTEPISGAEAYSRYMHHTLPHLERSGGEVLFYGSGGSFFIGPPDESWDAALLVRQSSLDAFRAFASDPGYLAGIGHRVAALEDSRLLPLLEQSY